MIGKASVARLDDRNVVRDEVHFRARGYGPDAQPISLTIVNISAMGLMARCETTCQPGDRISIRLPVIGVVAAELRWSLGGRIGCELERPIDIADYYELLAVMLKSL